MLVADFGYLRGREESPHYQVGHGRVGGEERWRWDRTGTPEWGLGEGRGSHAWRGPVMTRRSAGMQRDLRGIGGSEGNTASIFPTHSGTGEPVGLPGLNP